MEKVLPKKVLAQDSGQLVMSKSLRVNLSNKELEYLNSLLLRDAQSLTSAAIRLKLAKLELNKQASKQASIEDVMSIPSLLSATSEQDSILKASLNGSITEEQKERYFMLTGYKL